MDRHGKTAKGSRNLLLGVLSSAAAFAALLSGGCASERSDEIAGLVGKKELRIGVNADFKPLIFRSNGKPAGIEVDLAEKIGGIADVKTTFVEMRWDDLIPELESGRIDVIMSGMTITEERSRRIAFASPYVRVGQMALVRTSEINQFSTVAKVIGTERKVGFIANTTGAYFVNAKCVNAQKVAFTDTNDGMKALSEGRIDAFIVDAPIVWEMSTPSLTPLLEPLTDERLAWAVRKGDTRLLEALNKCLDTMRKDGSLEGIKSKWIPQLLLGK